MPFLIGSKTGSLWRTNWTMVDTNQVNKAATRRAFLLIDELV